MSTANAMYSARAAKFAGRKRVNQVATALALSAMAFGLFWLFWILWETVRLGLGGINWATFSQMTPPPNDEGGLANALYGSFLMVFLATCVGTPIGVNDLHIAGHARSEGLTLVTHNTREFERVPALQIEDWALDKR